jgi:nickel-dependent lactate racemase
LTPGVAALETIAKQHSFPIRPYDPAMGWMKGNPFHEVAVTVARTVGIDFIITPGGFPRDIDLHQAQKAMSTAEPVAADGGVIVLLAECADGIGKFAAWLKGAKSPQDVIERFKREGFTREHSSKAFMCARALAKHPVVVCCAGIAKSELEAMFFRPAGAPQDAVNQALQMKGGNARVLVLPYAVDCVPKIVAS